MSTSGYRWACHDVTKQNQAENDCNYNFIGDGLCDDMVKIKSSFLHLHFPENHFIFSATLRNTNLTKATVATIQTQTGTVNVRNVNAK